MAPFTALIIALVIVSLLFLAVYIASMDKEKDQRRFEEDLLAK